MSDIHSMPGHLIRRLNQISVSIFADKMAHAELDFTPVQFAALSVISRHPGLDQATLAGLIAYDRATLGGVVDRLENKGLVVRKLNKSDRRARALHLSEKGVKVLTRLVPIVSGLQDQILTGLDTDERQQFVVLLEKITAAGNELSRAPLQVQKES